jgi:hypothetical protein
VEGFARPSVIYTKEGLRVDIRFVGNGCFYIYLEGEDLADYTPPQCDLGTIELADVLRFDEDERVTLPEGAFLEIFPGNNAVLIFAREHIGAPSFFVFDSLEPLLEAAYACTRDITTFLIRADGRYFLVFYPKKREPPPAALSEFGDEAQYPPAFAKHITEHGRMLLGPSALRELRKVFFND